MKYLSGLLALAALTLPSVAHAGVGSTAYLGGYSDGTGWVPSIDYRDSGLLVQVHLLDLLGGLTMDFTNIGADVTSVIQKRKVAENVEGVVMLGGAVRYFQVKGLDGDFNLLLKSRMGAEMKEGAGFGIYVTPAIGITTASLSGDMGLAYGGGIEISCWGVK